jgi:c-di-GMP-binding flagellar brake protein YcgR
MNWDKRERRRFIRVSIPIDVTLKTSEGDVFQVNALNIGAGGFRVLLDEELEPGALLDVEAFLDKEAIKCRGRIVWSVKQTDTDNGDIVYDTGIEFYQIEGQEKEKINRFIDSLRLRGKVDD